MNRFTPYKVDDYDIFPDFIDGIRRKFGDRAAVSYFTRKQDERLFTYTDFTDRIYSLRESLYESGLAGKHIAVIGENSYDWLVAYLAIVSCGGVAVCIDAEQSDDTIKQMLSLADVHAAFVSEPYVPICRPALPSGRLLVICAEDGGDSAELRTLDAMCAEGSDIIASGKKPRVCETRPDDIASIVFTSGTSSMAKPVMLTHKNILQNASDAMRYVNTYTRVFSHLPFYHTYGMTCGVLSTLVKGGHLILNGNLKTVMRDLSLANAETIMTVPLLLESALNQIWLSAERAGRADALKRLLGVAEFLGKLGIRPKIRAIDELRRKAFGTVHLIITGGAALSADTERQLSLLGLTVLQGYGITECSPLVAVNNNDVKKFGSVGLVLSGFDIKIVDGEIYLRGISLMPGYYNSPELTAEVMEDGWFKTGDIGCIDKNGFLFITGRKKNLIIFKNGKKVAPEKMEELVRRIPLVGEVVVYGAANGSAVDDIKLAASIYPDPIRADGMSSYDILAALQSGIDEINAALPLYQHIKMINIRQQPFAKTGSQKIKRHMV